MTSKKDEMAARAARMAQRPTRATPPAPADEVEREVVAPTRAIPGTLGTSRTPVRTKPVRITTDLDPQTYRALTVYSADVAAAMGRAKVAHADVVRGLIAELQANADVRDRVAAHIATRLSK